MSHLHHTPQFLLPSILQGHCRLLRRTLLRLCLITISTIAIHTTSWADNKISAEEAFLQGQQYVEQANTALAALSLTRIPPTSPYAKLLAGNIAAKNGEFDRTFLLLLPLQSNNSLTKAAAASLHASLSSAYEKQGDSFNVLDQLIRRETYLEDAQAINSNQNRIWHLLAGLSVEDLITTRGESTDTSTQGWLDLSLVTRNQDAAAGISTWASSYPDHAATAFAKTLALVNPEQAKSQEHLPSNGSIALILPLADGESAAKADAFKLGLQAALMQHGMLNEIKMYPSPGNKESIAEQYALAKSEGAAYGIGPMLDEELAESGLDISAIMFSDANEPDSTPLHHAGLSLRDEAQDIAAFATGKAIQKVVIVATDSEAANQMVQSFQAVWANELGHQFQTITLPHSIKSGDSDLLDLKAKVHASQHDMLLLAMSAPEARIIRPYLDISTPTLAFSGIHEITNDVASNTSLNAVRFVDIPFLLDTDNVQFANYHGQSTALNSNELLRWFALGVDYLQLLIASGHEPGNEAIINGLSGKLILDKTGHVKRQLSMAKFTYNGVVLEQ